MFVEQCHIAIGNYLQALCLNRPRVRRRLRRGLEDWQHMRAHAMNADRCDELLSFLTSSKGGWSLTDHLDSPGPCMVRMLTLASQI
jgi:hypothetical protein